MDPRILWIHDTNLITRFGTAPEAIYLVIIEKIFRLNTKNMIKSTNPSIL